MVVTQALKVSARSLETLQYHSVPRGINASAFNAIQNEAIAKHELRQLFCQHRTMIATSGLTQTDFQALMLQCTMSYMMVFQC
jgi:hypothetical protein